jgi:hypothetical protein
MGEDAVRDSTSVSIPLSAVPLGVRVLDRQAVLRSEQSQIEFPRTTERQRQEQARNLAPR